MTCQYQASPAISLPLVLSHLHAVFKRPPYHGTRPILVIRSPSSFPRAVVNDLMRNPVSGWYIIHLALPPGDAIPENQAAYQLAHELGHFWINAFVEHAFVEVLCEAVALASLSRIAKAWESSDHLPRTYAAKFVKYRKNIENNALMFHGKSYLSRGVLPPNLDILSTTVGPSHILAASVLALELDSADDWSVLLSVKDHLGPGCEVNFHEWLAQLHDDDTGCQLAKVIAAIFDPLCGVAVSSTQTGVQHTTISPCKCLQMMFSAMLNRFFYKS